jgi:hypothetical protein
MTEHKHWSKYSHWDYDSWIPPLFYELTLLPPQFQVIDEWQLKNTHFSKIQNYLETTEDPKLVVSCLDQVHPYYNNLYNEILIYLRTYFLKNTKGLLIYYSVNDYHSVFDGIKNIEYHYMPEWHANYWPLYKNIELTQTDVVKKFLCLNKRACVSRWLLYKKFFTDNLLQHSIFSFLGEDQRHGQLKCESIIDRYKTCVSATHPLFKHLKTPTSRFIEIENDQDLKKYIQNSEPLPRGSDASWNSDQTFYQLTFCSIIGETGWNADKPNFSEKTFRAMCNGHPFIIIGATHSLKFLRDLGFDTFDDIFDNSYDHIVDPNWRLAAVFNTVDKISKKDINELNQINREIHSRKLKNIETYKQLYWALIDKTNQLIPLLNKRAQDLV